MIPNKKYLTLWILSALVVIGIIAVAIYYFTQQSYTTSQSQVPAPTENASVTISNLTAHASDLDITLRSDIESSLNQYIQAMHPKSAATGVIRDGSYVVTTNDIGKNIVFLVDFESIKVSYKIDIGLSESENTLYVVCPTKEELRYPPFECKDSFSV